MRSQVGNPHFRKSSGGQGGVLAISIECMPTAPLGMNPVKAYSRTGWKELDLRICPVDPAKPRLSIKPRMEIGTSLDLIASSVVAALVGQKRYALNGRVGFSWSS